MALEKFINSKKDLNEKYYFISGASAERIEEVDNCLWVCTKEDLLKENDELFNKENEDMHFIPASKVLEVCESIPTIRLEKETMTLGLDKEQTKEVIEMFKGYFEDER